MSARVSSLLRLGIRRRGPERCVTGHDLLDPLTCGLSHSTVPLVENLRMVPGASRGRRRRLADEPRKGRAVMPLHYRLLARGFQLASGRITRPPTAYDAFAA